MIIVEHRRNTIAELQATPPLHGVEIDLRNHGDDILVTHDPFITDAVPLREWLVHYRHRFLIANVKEEGLEPILTELLAEHGVRDFFILDESFPFIRKFALAGLPNFAVRVSEFESVDTAINLAADVQAQGHRVDWIWVDSFTGAPINPHAAGRLRMSGYALCAVSPELHHVSDPASWEAHITNFLDRLAHPDMVDSRPDMVCTKRPDLWIDFATQ